MANVPCGVESESGDVLKIRKSTKRRWGEVRTMVEVGSEAWSGSQRMDFRMEMLPMVGDDGVWLID